MAPVAGVTRRALARSRVLALAVALAAIAACTADPPPGPDTMTAPMTVEQVRAEIETTKARLALPEGADWFPIELTAGSYGEYAGAQMIEWQAMCAWFLEARAAKVEGDQARFGAALTVIEQIPGWRSFSDPKLLDDTGREIIRRGAEAALRGDFTAIGPFLQANCTR